MTGAIRSSMPSSSAIAPVDWAAFFSLGTPNMPHSTRRIMALWLPRLPTDRLIRRAPSRSEAPLIVSHKANNALYVYGLNRPAQRLGLYKGQPLANARAMVQPLVIAPADEKADAALLEHIADWCDRFTPLVTLDPSEGLLLDITGAAHLFGGATQMLATVTCLIALQGFSVSWAIAGSSLEELALARDASGTFTLTGRDAVVISQLSITALDCDDKALRALAFTLHDAA